MTATMPPPAVDCVLCDTPFLNATERFHAVPLYSNDGTRHAHRECALQAVQVPLGHHMNHELWCVERNDPYCGFTARESALQVWKLFKERPYGG